MSYWKVLGIEATRDLPTIKRAYAAKLKDCHPEDDPEGFQRLRGAYESALRYATPRKPLEATAIIDPKVRRAMSAKAKVKRDVATVDEPVAPNPQPAQAAEPDSALSKQAAKVESPPPPPPDPMIALRAEHEARCRDLWQMLARREGADPDSLRAMLDSILKSEAMDSVGVHTRTEQWLAGFIADSTPRSDPLVGPSIAYFGWRADRLTRGHDASQRVLARADDLVFMEGLRRQQGEHADAWKALNAKPTKLQAFLHRATPSLPDQVRRLRDLIQRERPTLRGDLEPEGAAWWDAYLAKPQLPAGVAWVVMVFGLVFGLAFSQSRPFNQLPGAPATGTLASFVTWIAVAVALLAGWLYGVARPRERWMREARYAAPLWKRLGWAPATLVLVIASALAPPLPWLAPIFAVASLWLVYWVAITGEPDRRVSVGEPWRLAKFWNPIWMLASIVVMFVLAPNRRFPWQTRAVFNFTYLAIFWVLVWPVLGLPVWAAMSFPVVAGMIAFTLGFGSLLDAWQSDLDDPTRRMLRFALGAVVLLAFAATVAIDSSAAYTQIAAGLLVVAVFGHKVLDGEIGPETRLMRDVAMRYGWLGWIVVLSAVLGLKAPFRDMEIRIGLGLLTGPAIVAGRVLLGPLFARKSKAKPKSKRKAA